MGKIIIAGSQSFGLLKPVIYCRPDKAASESAVPLNRALAQKLYAVKPKRRTMLLAACFEEVLNTLPDDVLIKDFDVMFNPEYKVDVLKIMADVCKRKPFGVIWPGKYDDGKLFYAEEGYMDFKIFNIEKYDVTCVI